MSGDQEQPNAPRGFVTIAGWIGGVTLVAGALALAVSRIGDVGSEWCKQGLWGCPSPTPTAAPTIGPIRIPKPVGPITYKGHEPWSSPDDEAMAKYINNDCKPRTLSDFFGMVSQVEGGNWSLYIFCKVQSEQDEPSPITVTVTEVNWPVSGGGAAAFIRESLNGRQAVVLGMANGNNVWIAYKN